MADPSRLCTLSTAPRFPLCLSSESKIILYSGESQRQNEHGNGLRGEGTAQIFALGFEYRLSLSLLSNPIHPSKPSLSVRHANTIRHDCSVLTLAQV